MLGVCVGQVYDQNATKMRPKRDLRFLPAHSVIIIKTFSCVGLAFCIFSDVFLAFSLTFCWYHKHEQKRERNVRKTGENKKRDWNNV